MTNTITVTLSQKRHDAYLDTLRKRYNKPRAILKALTVAAVREACAMQERGIPLMPNHLTNHQERRLRDAVNWAELHSDDPNSFTAIKAVINDIVQAVPHG